jgi:hypothetical protein
LHSPRHHEAASKTDPIVFAARIKRRHEGNEEHELDCSTSLDFQENRFA